jgi:hypothetical protein
MTEIPAAPPRSTTHPAPASAPEHRPLTTHPAPASALITGRPFGNSPFTRTPAPPSGECWLAGMPPAPSRSPDQEL